MSRLAPVAWLAALCAAIYPTWHTWSVDVGEEWFSFCPLAYVPVPVLREAYVLPLRADTGALLWYGLSWAIPALLVLTGWVHRRSAVAGRRVAAALVPFALFEPLTRPYRIPELCGEALVFSGWWAEKVWERLGTSPYVLVLLAATLLVLIATKDAPEERRAVPPRGRALRPVMAFLIAYEVVAVSLVVSGIMPLDSMGFGLWLWSADLLFPDIPLLYGPLVAVLAFVLLALSTVVILVRRLGARKESHAVPEEAALFSVR